MWYIYKVTGHFNYFPKYLSQIGLVDPAALAEYIESINVLNMTDS